MYNRCGCRTIKADIVPKGYGKTHIVYCSLHAAAPELLETLKRIANYPQEEICADVQDIQSIARKAIAESDVK